MTPIQIGVIDLGCTGAALVRRVLAAGRPCVVYDRSPRTVAELAAERAHGASSVSDLVHELDAPRAIWLAGPAAEIDATIAELRPFVEPGDVILATAESDYAEDIRRADALAAVHVHYVDVGICGSIATHDDTCCLTIGGEEAVVRSLGPMFEAIASPGAYLHCGPAGAGHFVTLIHNGIERRLTAAYAEGFRMLRAASTAWTDRGPDYEFDVPAIVDVWRHGAPVASPVMERACREQAAAHEADCGLPELHR